MGQEEPTLKNIGKEVFASGYLERARSRKRTSKTIWDFIFMPIGFGAVGAFWYAFVKLFLWFHLLVYPGDATRLDATANTPMAIATGLMFIAPVFSAIPLGFLTSNVLMWLIPPARRASEKNAEGVKWASFHEAQVVLLKIALVLVPLGVVSGIVGALIIVR